MIPQKFRTAAIAGTRTSPFCELQERFYIWKTYVESDFGYIRRALQYSEHDLLLLAFENVMPSRILTYHVYVVIAKLIIIATIVKFEDIAIP